MFKPIWLLIALFSISHVGAIGILSQGINVVFEGGAPENAADSADILDKLIHPSKITPPKHPLDPLTALEIRTAALIIRANNRTLTLLFKCIGLREPEKALLLPYFLSGSVPPPGSIPRKADVLVADAKTRAAALVVVNLDTHKVESWTDARADQHAPTITIEDQETVKNVALSDARVVKRINDLGFNDLSMVVIDVWDSSYVADQPDYAAVRKLLQLFFYVLLGNGDNYFAHPFDFVVYVDLAEKVVRGIEDLPIQHDFDRTNRTGNSVPTAPATLLPDSLPPNSIRGDVKPIAISRPEGVSFTVDGRLISWQNFTFHVGYTPREGTLINQVGYVDNGKLRPLFYRLSISEVYIYYADPRPPYQRKASYNMGNFNYGTASRSLSPEFCRGQAYYYDSVVSNERGETAVVKNSTCIFEEDAGLLWAHYDAPSGKQAVTRRQRLSVSSYVNIGSCDFFMSWRFYQDATIELSVLLTGTQNSNLMAVDVKAPIYGNLVMSQVYTQNPQHFIGARIDADVDGENNTVSLEDIVSVPPANNPYGNGIQEDSTVFRKVADAPSDITPGRTWKISNPSEVNPVTGKHPAWKLVPQGPNMPNLLAPGGPLRRKISWAEHNTWVLPYSDEQLFIDGLYLDGGVANWTLESAGKNIENTDVVLWYVIGTWYSPDPDAWPVISDYPDTVGFRLRPSSFFTQNPAVHVPPASQTTSYDDKYSTTGYTGWKTVDNDKDGMESDS